MLFFYSYFWLIPKITKIKDQRKEIVEDKLSQVTALKDKISSLTTVDIPNQPNAINGEDLMKKLKNFKNVNYKKSIKEAINSIDLNDNDIIIITGSLYLAGEVLNLN